MSIELPALPDGYSIRKIQYSDFHNGVLVTLATLTTVGEISELEFRSVIDTWNSSGGLYNVYVVVNQLSEVVAVGTIIVELKLIHKCGKVGHIEDISVRPDQQGNKLGLFLIRYLMRVGFEKECYKVILDCDVKNEGFYIKCGFKKAGLEMEYRY